MPFVTFEGVEDISPREIYCIFRTDGTRRQMTEFDELISAQVIFDANDEIDPPDSSGCVSQNWLINLRNRRIRNELNQNPDALDFTAQTTIASSYGLLQILYSTAIAPMQWPGVNGARNPRFLFDTPSNVTNGGGSLVLGSGYLADKFIDLNSAALVVNPDFASQEELEREFRRALNRYNNSPLDTGAYGIDVLNFSKIDFLPIASGPIFGLTLTRSAMNH